MVILPVQRARLSGTVTILGRPPWKNYRRVSLATPAATNHPVVSLVTTWDVLGVTLLIDPSLAGCRG